jgi:hypothetical protein
MTVMKIADLILDALDDAPLTATGFRGSFADFNWLMQSTGCNDVELAAEIDLLMSRGLVTVIEGHQDDSPRQIYVSAG